MTANKKVEVYDADTDELVMEFESLTECAKYFGVDLAYISNHIKGRTKTIKNKQYYCKAIERIYHTDNTEWKGNRPPKPIDVYEDNGLLATYDNVKLAANATGISPASIYQYCRGERKKPIRGYTFKYNLKRQLEIKKIPVDLYDVDTNEIYESFDDITECANFLGLTVQTIRANLRGDSRTVKCGSFYCKKREQNG